MVLGQYMAILAGTWWYWVSISWYLAVLGHYRAVLVGIWWYLVSMG